MLMDRMRKCYPPVAEKFSVSTGEHGGQMSGLPHNGICGLRKNKNQIFNLNLEKLVNLINLPAQNQEPNWPILYPWLSADWILQEEVQPWTEISFEQVNLDINIRMFDYRKTTDTRTTGIYKFNMLHLFGTYTNSVIPLDIICQIFIFPYGRGYRPYLLC